MNSAIGLVIALPAEARALLGRGPWQRQGGQVFRHALLGKDTGLIAVRSGLGMENSLAAGRWLTKKDVAALGSLGVSGGLDPSLEPGDIILADSVAQKSGDTLEQVWEAPPPFVDTALAVLKGRQIPVYRGAIITVQRPLLSARDKKRLFAQTRALAIDMESAGVALAAKEANLPFFALRAICDPATRTLPGDLFNSLDQAGHIHLFHILRMLLLKPALVSDLLRAKRDFAAASASLGHAWNVLIKNNLPDLVQSHFREKAL
jgi:adenosylhomocysteine nucleosidase